MLIPLDHPVWARLYGPYGVANVADSLRQLLTTWDKAQADDLFWEKLHHQETLYPVTYAALPWLIQVARRHPIARADIHLFVSWVLYCAYSRHGDRFQFNGHIPDFGSPYRHEDDAQLEQDHGAMLADLAEWFGEATPSLSETCQTATDTAPVDDVGYMLCGPAMVLGAEWLASSLQGIPTSETVARLPRLRRTT